MRWQWHQLDHMQIICTFLHTDNHATTSSLNFLQARCSSWRPSNSVKALRKNVYNQMFAQNCLIWATWNHCHNQGSCNVIGKTFVDFSNFSEAFEDLSPVFSRTYLNKIDILGMVSDTVTPDSLSHTVNINIYRMKQTTIRYDDIYVHPKANKASLISHTEPNKK